MQLVVLLIEKVDLLSAARFRPTSPVRALLALGKNVGVNVGAIGSGYK